MTNRTTEAKLRKWLTIARPAWSYPLEKDEASALLGEIERLRCGLNEVRDFLNKPEWGTYRYMEGTGVYEDKDAALFNIAYALGETDANS